MMQNERYSYIYNYINIKLIIREKEIEDNINKLTSELMEKSEKVLKSKDVLS